jgi:gliding motility-associated-like protein
MKSNALCLFFLMLQLSVIAQIDTEFWFAAPEVSENGLDYDKPIRLFLSAQDEAATVSIRQPANELFTPITLTLAANTTQEVDLTAFIGFLENDLPDQVLNRGLFIAASQPIAAYYEVASLNCFCNPEIFVLKGANALGRDFWVPFQTYWANNPNYTPTPYSAFDMVATENGTTVTITPSEAIVGHAADIPFTITLNAGETYSARSQSQAADLHPAGSRVIADKPIAITMKDDLLFADDYGGCRDLLGDQIIPTRLIGTNYIIVKGFLNNQDKVFVLGTESNTTVMANGNTLGTIGAGETLEIDLATEVMALEASNPVYVLHVTGFGCEVGAAVLPPLDCAGSQSISFTRSTDESFGVGIVVRSGLEDQFTLNGVGLTGDIFSPVPGTNGEWVYTQQQFTTAAVPVGLASTIENAGGVFQMAVINGGFVSGCRYGYFSAFNELQVNLGGDQVWCSGSTLVLSPNISSSGVEFLWQDGSTEATFNVQEPGLHWVEATIGNCYGADTIEVVTGETPFFSLPNDTVLCEGATLTLAPAVEGSFLWQDGSTATSYAITEAGTYRLDVTDDGCTHTETIFVDYLDFPVVQLGADTVICEGSSVLLDGSQPDAIQYSWSDGVEGPVREIMEPGLYTLSVTNACGVGAASKRIAAKPCILTCALQAPNAFSPNDDGFNDGFTVYPPACTVVEWEMHIFNRWGEVVFTSNNWEEPWDGTFRGAPMSPGVFVWLVQAVFENGFGELQQVQENGDIILIR